MAFTALRTWVAGEIVTADMMNEQIRDNGNEYIQRTGTIPLTADWDAGSYEIRARTLESDVATGTAPLTVASDTVVTDLNADKVDGQHRSLIISTNHTHQSTGAQGGQLDHGLALTGLTDDDHTQYQKESLLTTAGDLPYATADSTWQRLAIGTVNQLLRTNSGATAPEWGILTASGSYTGNDSANRAIPHGLGITPKIVFLEAINFVYVIFGAVASILCLYNVSGTATWSDTVVTISDSTNFYVGNAVGYDRTANNNGTTYYWVAIA